MLVCTICKDEIYYNKDIKCNKSKIILHFACAGLRNVNFSKMSIANKGNGAVEIAKILVLKQLRFLVKTIQSDKLFLDLKDSVNFMSGKFNDFNMQLLDIIKSINDV